MKNLIKYVLKNEPIFCINEIKLAKNKQWK